MCDVEASRSDPLPFQWLSKDAKLCKDVLFVDVDYPALIKKKSDIIQSTPQLLQLLGPLESHEAHEGLFLKSKAYLSMGCDLASTDELEGHLKENFEVSDVMILCVAEVAIAYMTVEAADNLIRWAAGQANRDKPFVYSCGTTYLTFHTSPFLRIGTVPSRWCRSSICENNAPAF